MLSTHDPESREKDPASIPVPLLWDIEPVPATALLASGRNELDFGGKNGYLAGPSLTPPEVTRVRELVHQHLHNNALQIAPDIAPALQTTSLEDIHTLAHFDGVRLLNNQARVLSKAIADEIMGMSLFDYIREAFGDFRLGHDTIPDHENIGFRLVRPDRREDVGCLHRDDWFYRLNTTNLPAGFSRAKVWIPICSTPNLDGLRLIAGSHRYDLPYLPEQRTGKAYFATNIDLDDVPLGVFAGANGSSIFFNYHTLHVGSLNRSRSSRVSIETTILYRGEA
jgi:hypothetical protein